MKSSVEFRVVSFFLFTLIMRTLGHSLVEVKGSVNKICRISNGTIQQCTDNAFCNLNSNLCQCFAGYLPTSYGICLPGIGTSCANFKCNEESFLNCFEVSEEGQESPMCTCTLKGTHWSNTQSKCVASEGSSCSDSLSCTDNAVCNYFNCHCKEGFSHTQDNYCLLAYGSKCLHDSENQTTTLCNPDNFLHCDLNEICTCQSGYTWDGYMCLAQIGQKCDLKVTSEMTKVSVCIPSAKCTPGNITSDNDPSQLRVGSCQCPSGTRKNEAGDICSGGGRLLESGIFLAILITQAIF